jgi:hypothetical protein
MDSLRFFICLAYVSVPARPSINARLSTGNKTWNLDPCNEHAPIESSKGVIANNGIEESGKKRARNMNDNHKGESTR